PSQKVTLANTGDIAYTIHATLAAGSSSPFALDVATATLAAQSGGTPGSLELTLTPHIDPALAQPGALEDTLVISPVGPSWGAPIELALTMTVRGAVLSFATAPDTFADVDAGGAGAAQTVMLRNDGNLAANPLLAIAASSNPEEPFSVDLQPDSIAAG